MLEIIIGCGVCILLLILLIIIYHNKFQYVIIKIEEAEMCRKRRKEGEKQINVKLCILLRQRGKE